MSRWRFEQIRRFVPFIMCDPDLKDSGDDWWMLRPFVGAFNSTRSKRVAASIKKLLDESMSAFRPRTTKKGGLPHISFISRKPEPLGTEFKVVCCSVTGIFLFIEVQEGKLPMRTMRHSEAPNGPTVGCVKRLVEGSMASGQTRVDAHSRRDIYFGDSWFTQTKTAETVHNENDVHFVGQLKTGHAKFPKKWLEEQMDEMPSGNWITLECTGRNGVPLVGMGYKYSSKKTLLFVMSKGSGATTKGIPYIAKYCDNNGNVHEREIDRPQVLSDYFMRSNL
jgi:hypothetical protein